MTLNGVASYPGVDNHPYALEVEVNDVATRRSWLVGPKRDAGKYTFPPHVVVAKPVPLAELDLEDDEELLIIERDGVERGFLIRELAYHHVIQGELNGRPYAVAFCVVCSTGVGLTPVVDGKVLHFGSNGVENGVGVISDRESWSLWEPMTGECTEGPHEGRSLEVWPVRPTTVAAARRERPGLELSLTNCRSLTSWLVQKTWPRVLDNRRGFIPPPFFRTMAGRIDDRMHRLELGLGVMLGGRHVFFPLESIPKGGDAMIRVGSRMMKVYRGEVDGVPHATWCAPWDDEDPPMQMFTRWYAFSFRYPECELWQGPKLERGTGVPEARAWLTSTGRFRSR